MIDHAIDAAGAEEARGNSAAQRIGERQAIGVEALAVELAEMVPEAEAPDARQPGRVLVLVIFELRLAHEQRRVLYSEIQAIAVLDLRILRTRAGRITIEQREQAHKPLVRGFIFQPDPGR